MCIVWFRGIGFKASSKVQGRGGGRVFIRQWVATWLWWITVGFVFVFAFKALLLLWPQAFLSQINRANKGFSGIVKDMTVVLGDKFPCRLHGLSRGWLNIWDVNPKSVYSWPTVFDGGPTLTLSILKLPLSLLVTTRRELVSQFSTCSEWRWLEVGGK